MIGALWIRVGAVAVFVLSLAASQACRFEAASATAEDEAIRAAIRTFETGWNDHNMETMFQAFTPDAEWVNIVGMWWRGLPDVKRAHLAYHETTFKDHSYRIEDVRIRRVTSDAAVAIVRWKKGSFVDPAGNRRPEGKDLMSLLLVKQDGRWMIASGHNTTIDEAAEQFNPVGR